ncbi:F-box/LRR-repeat protein 3-like [Pogonomyrmex barbatus]|uniref:F-box/LRR-repeat protein 3-like n=1 Tax=Pogonomyrmex barbatus TaxID=144034 RepID=A0A6I9WTJ8_9HYME|nr:F-box/LRR-repeat protein 3-like [Pogonomyrmex barbatus]XP_011643066.1 F-box/LRR-repeat protein 3-like [Pogonomyrmex barbatus]
MFAVTNTTKLTSFGIDSEHFKSVVMISKTRNAECRKKHLRNDENDPRTLCLMRIKGFPRLLPEGILTLANYSRWLRELSLSYALLSDELLLALCSVKQICLEILRVEVYPEAKPLPRISDEAWSAFSNHLPDVNLALLSYIIDDDDQKLLFTSHIPVTHLYLGDATSELIMSRISKQCPRLIELVIAAYGSGPIDRFLISMAKDCTHLSAVGLGDCEITCSGLAKFVTLCANRLQALYISETSLIEDEDFDIAKVSTNLSSLLGWTWVPEYVPLW